MEKKKFTEIEKMAEIVKGYCESCPVKDKEQETCLLCKMEHLYNHGYRKQEWISVEDRLPNETGNYLVTDITEYIPVIWIQKFKAECRWFPTFKEPCFAYFDSDVYIKLKARITHWMPLPQPPQMKGE